MRIAQVAPLFESVPPRLYGGTERVVAHLTEELVRRGHDVTLFASGDSVTSATLVPFRKQALRMDSTVRDPWAPHMFMFEQVAKRARGFDVVHFHTDYFHFSLMRRLRVPWLTTLHGRLDMPELWPVFAEFQDAPLVSITNAQRRLPRANWAATVYHGLPLHRYPWEEKAGEYLSFIGRMDEDKGPDQAIEIAKRAGIPLKMAGKIEPQHLPYFNAKVRPRLAEGKVEYLGEVSEEEKLALMRNALCVLFPIRWPEPFGLVMIEAMAGGTPVVAYDWGSVPEVVDEGITGCVVPDDPAAAAEAVGRAAKLERRKVRARFEERFSSGRMARDYLALYERLIETWSKPGPAARARSGPAPHARSFPPPARVVAPGRPRPPPARRPGAPTPVAAPLPSLPVPEAAKPLPDAPVSAGNGQP